MANGELRDLREAVIQGAQALIKAGVLSGSLHGNWSVRAPGADRFWLTGSSLDGLRPEDMALMSLEGDVIEGGLSATSAEIIKMHACVYIERADVGSVVHTHSPFATAFAVANEPLRVYSEALARLGSGDAIPVAAYGPRGSEESVQNIVAARRSTPSQPAVLLANHGLLAWGVDAAAAQRMVMAMEETAQLAVLASAIGTPQALPAHLAVAAVQRRAQFEAAGPLRA